MAFEIQAQGLAGLADDVVARNRIDEEIKSEGLFPVTLGEGAALDLGQHRHPVQVVGGRQGRSQD